MKKEKEQEEKNKTGQEREREREREREGEREREERARERKRARMHGNCWLDSYLLNVSPNVSNAADMPANRSCASFFLSSSSVMARSG